MITDLFNKLFLTKRTKLVPLDQVHRNFIFELVNTKDWKKFIGERNINSIADANNYISKIQTLPDTEYWVVEDNETKNSLGIITLMKRAHLDFYDLGFAFLDDFKGKGFAFEASEIIIKYIKENTSLKSLGAITLKENYNSIKLLEKLQFSFQKEFTENEENLFLYQLELK
jgi:[ribosomal protein S5]-alanine N-acetyltransferase